MNKDIDKLEMLHILMFVLYLTKLYEKKLSRKSVARKISCLRSFYKFLAKGKDH